MGLYLLVVFYLFLYFLILSGFTLVVMRKRTINFVKMKIEEFINTIEIRSGVLERTEGSLSEWHVKTIGYFNTFFGTGNLSTQNFKLLSEQYEIAIKNKSPYDKITIDRDFKIKFENHIKILIGQLKAEAYPEMMRKYEKENPQIKTTETKTKDETEKKKE